MYNFKEMFYLLDGTLYWKCGRMSGKPAGYKRKDGYIYVSIGEKGRFMAHRIVWEMHNGPIPEGMYIDHINHNKQDNSLNNLRLVTCRENSKNMPKATRNTSGVTGVSWNIGAKKWIVTIGVNRKKIHIGLFDDIESAAMARADAERKYSFHENHGGVKNESR